MPSDLTDDEREAAAERVEEWLRLAAAAKLSPDGALAMLAEMPAAVRALSPAPKEPDHG